MENVYYQPVRVRTDLALEARETVSDADGSLHGVKVTEEHDDENNIHITRVQIETKNGSKIMGKPIGTYITIEAPEMVMQDDGYHREISEKIAKQLQSLIFPEDKEYEVLVVGLGNREVTADALGPRVAEQLRITRHVIREFGKAAYNQEKMNQISSIVPGVMAKTGMETAEIIRGIVEETEPDVIIAIDALAARSIRRMNRTIQITDTGIHPGSGVGNYRHALTFESLNVPVIGVGIPTVVDAATIVNDVLMKENISLDKEKLGYRMEELENMYVTSKDIDELVERISFTLSEAINIALNIREVV